MSVRDIYSTQEVADLLGLSARTIIIWIDKGDLDAYKTLGGHRRIKKHTLIEFLQKNNIPLPDGLVNPEIIIVDDDEAVRNSIERMLVERFSNIPVTKFESTVDALLYLQTGKNKIMLLDVVMPYMDGLELCSRIKKNEKTSDAKIIAISGHLSLSNKDEVISAGADDFFSKTEPLPGLMDKVEVLLNEMDYQPRTAYA